MSCRQSGWLAKYVSAPETKQIADCCEYFLLIKFQKPIQIESEIEPNDDDD